MKSGVNIQEIKNKNISMVNSYHHKISVHKITSQFIFKVNLSRLFVEFTIFRPHTHAQLAFAHHALRPHARPLFCSVLFTRCRFVFDVFVDYCVENRHGAMEREIERETSLLLRTLFPRRRDRTGFPGHATRGLPGHRRSLPLLYEG